MVTNSENSYLHQFGPCVAEGRREKYGEWGSRAMVHEVMESGNRVRKLSTLEGLDSDARKPITTGHEFTLYISKLERVGERQNIWHDLCSIAGREEPTGRKNGH